MTPTTAFAEVVASSLQTVTAQCWDWRTAPRFGSIVEIKTKETTLLCAVYDTKTGTLDGNRQPFAYQKTEEELLREQPQIFAFLTTTFSCLVLGYTEGGAIKYQWAPKPAAIHAFVTPASAAICAELFTSERYLHLIFNAGSVIPTTDELLLAVLSEQAAQGLLPKERLFTYLETFSLLTGNDYRRLKLFLQRAVFLQQIR